MSKSRLNIVLMFFAMLFASSANVSAQTRVLVGASGAQAFDNSSVGVMAGIEVPFAKHYEFDLKDTFSPIESHVALGGGRANIINAGGYIWFGQHWGLTGSAEDSMYDVTQVTKDADYAFGGLAWRGMLGGAPTRFAFQYIRQFNNGISPSGLETSHLQGGDIGFTMRFGCLKNFCVRNSEDFVFGRVLTQGPPQCDGSFGGKITCPRGSAFGGGVTVSIALEFPRRKNHEHDVF